MTVRCTSARVEVSPTPQSRLEITQQKKMLKMKIAPQNMLKTQGQKNSSSEFYENKGVAVFSRLLTERKGDSLNFKGVEKHGFRPLP